MRYTFRPARDGSPACGILVTVPSRFVLADVQRSVEEMRPRLRVLVQKQQQQPSQPQPTDEQRADLKRRIERMRVLAKRDLPPKLLALAEEYGFKVKEVKISSARTRWGSCVARKRRLWGKKEYTINLSLYCILLPEHLQRLIMLHELTHIHHMDHSPAFHAELDAMLGGNEKALEQELKRYNTNIFSF